MQKKGPSFDEPFLFRAGKEIRTLDPNLGKVMLYQLSYSRDRCTNYSKVVLSFKGIVEYFFSIQKGGKPT